MNVSVVDVNLSRKKVRVEIPAQKVLQESETRYRDLAKNARIKGFRPGKVPRSILKSYYGKSVEQEVSSQLIQETFPEALKKSEIKPLVEADVDEMHFEDDGRFTYEAVVEVAPEFQLAEYKGIRVQRRPALVTDEEIDAELERIRQQHAQLKTLDEERPLRNGDIALVDFIPTVDGKVFEKGKTNDYMIEIGKNALHPEFDEKLMGKLAGETLSFHLDYPPDTQTPELAGKTVHFDLSIKEVKEKTVPELNDDFAQEVGAQFDNLNALRQEISEQMQKRKNEEVSREVQTQLMDKILEITSFELSTKVVDREVDRLIGLLKYQFESQGLKVDGLNLDTPGIRAEYRVQAEKNVRWRLIAQRIAESEGLELTEDEIEEIYKEVARATRSDIETVRRDFAESSYVEQARENSIQSKVLKTLESEAIYVEASEDAKVSDEE